MKKFILIFIYTIILAVLLSYSLTAQVNRYVDKNAPGNNTGGSWTNAWESFGDIVWSQLTPGSSLYISGGTDSTIYYETLTPQCRGTFANRINIIAGKYAPSPSGHSGRVIIDGGGSMANNADMGSYTGTHTGSNNQAAIMTDVNANHGEDFDVNRLTGLTITNYTDALWHPLPSPGYWTYGTGTIVSNTATTITVSGMSDGADNDFDTGDAYEIIPRSDGIFINEYAATAPAYINIKGFETRWGTAGAHFDMDATTASGLCTHVVIDSCYLAFYYDLAGYFVNGGARFPELKNCIIRTCLNCGYQTDGIQLTGTPTQYPFWIILHDNIIYNTNQDPNAHNDAIQGVFYNDGIISYNNIIINDSVYSPEGGGLPYILSDFNAHGSDNPVILFNNFCYMGGAWWPGANEGYTFWSRFESGGIEAWMPPNYIFNNTIVTNGPNLGGYDNQYQPWLWINNISAMWCQPSVRSEWKSAIGISSNFGHTTHIDSIRNILAWKEDNDQDLLAGTGWAWDGGSGDVGGWSGFIAKGGVGINADPKFVNHFGREPDQTQLRPDLQSNSPAIGAGSSIRYLYEYFKDTYPEIPVEHFDAMLKDIYGNPRDIDNPSIGAYEYTVGGWVPPDTIPTFSFAPVTGAELNTRYIGSAVFNTTEPDSTFHVWTVTADSFKIDAGVYNLTMQIAVDGNTVYTPVITGGSYSTAYTNTIVAGGQSRTYSVTTKSDPGAPDTIPYFHFTDVTNAELNSYYIAYAIFINANSTFHVSSADSFKVGLQGIWRKNGYQTPANNGDTVFVANSASNFYLTPENVTVTAGGFVDIFSITTKAPPGLGGINGGWIDNSIGIKLYDKNGKPITTKRPQ